MADVGHELAAIRFVVVSDQEYSIVITITTVGKSRNKNPNLKKIWKRRWKSFADSKSRISGTKQIFGKKIKARRRIKYWNLKFFVCDLIKDKVKSIRKDINKVFFRSHLSYPNNHQIFSWKILKSFWIFLLSRSLDEVDARIFLQVSFFFKQEKA